MTEPGVPEGTSTDVPGPSAGVTGTGGDAGVTGPGGDVAAGPGAAAAAGTSAAGAGVSATGDRRRVHPVTPLVHGVRAIPIVLVAMVAFGGSNIGRYGFRGLLLGIGAALALGALVAGVSFLQWQRREYWFDDDGDFRLDSGILTRQERRLQLSRLQSVDVVQPLIARIVGMAELRIEVAGVGDSRAVLQYLTLADATRLRAEILARAAGVRHDAGEAPEQVIVRVPTRDLALSLVIRGVTFSLLILTVVLIVVTVLTEGVAGLGLLFVTGVPLFVVFGEFNRFFDFTVAESPDGLRLRHGLLASQSQTVPPGRVQAVDFVEPLLWRRFGWMRVNLNVAGSSGPGSDGSGGDVARSVLLPVAPREVARAVVARVLPGVDIDAVPLVPAPDRARFRSPFQWRRLAVGHDERVLVTRRGWLTHRLEVIPHARTQSVRLHQGPWERRLGLASVSVDSTPGPVNVRVLRRDAGEARALADAQADRAMHARATAGPERWMSHRPETVSPAGPLSAAVLPDSQDSEHLRETP